MIGYRPDIPPHVAEAIRTLPPDVKRVVKAALRALAADPSAGEPLRGKLQGLMKYRVKRYRIVYQADRPRRALRIFAVVHRRAVYEELADAIRRSPK